MRIFIGILVLAASVFTFLLFEGICFRMVEKYASFRLEKVGVLSFQKILTNI